MENFTSYFYNLLVLCPLVLLARAIYPQAITVRISLTVVGIYSLFLVAPRFVLFYLGYWCVLWGFLQLSMRAEKHASARVQNGVLILAILVFLAPMVSWKIFPETFPTFMNFAFAKAFWTLFPGLGYVDALAAVGVPLGLSFAAFRAIDLFLKVWLGLYPAPSFGRTLYYGFFPPILALGPISEYEEVRLEGPQPRFPHPGDLAVGVFRVAFGCLKVLLVAYLFERASAYAWQGGASGAGLRWVAVLTFGIYFYANFSGYSDIAIGVARLFGIKLKENFNNPFFKTNPQQFWNAWHMSLTRWAQRYVFVPLGGMRKNRQYFAIFSTIMVIALWHGLGLPLIVFGIYHATIVVAHRWLEQKRGRKKIEDPVWLRVLKSIMVLTYVSLSIPLFMLRADEIIPFYLSLLSL